MALLVLRQKHRHYDLWVKEAIKCGADAIVSGAGLPVRLPEYAQAAYEEMKAGIADAKETCGEICKQAVKKVKLAPIVSSAKSAQVICRLWGTESISRFLTWW